MDRVKGKVTIVTGGASGIGKATSQLLSAEGATLILTDLNRSGGKTLAEEIGGSFLYHDASDEASWDAVMESVLGKFGRLDVLVNNAGILEDASVSDPETTTLESWNRIHAVNAAGVFLGCKYAISAMRKSGGGSIINISSLAALVATPFAMAYGASKAAVRQLTMSVAVHCAKAGYRIRCNSVHPGQIATPMLEGLLSDIAKSANMTLEVMRGECLKQIPLGEFGEPADIANAVLYLASDDSKHVTGEQLVVDGGINISR